MTLDDENMAQTLKNNAQKFISHQQLSVKRQVHQFLKVNNKLKTTTAIQYKDSLTEIITIFTLIRVLLFQHGFLVGSFVNHNFLARYSLYSLIYPVLNTR